MRKNIVKIIILHLGVLTCILGLLVSNTVNAKEQTPINVATPSKEEIARYFIENNILHSYEVSYTEEPSASAPYSLGKVSEQTLDDALRLLNAIRYVAGIGANVVLDDEYNTLAQGAALVNAANKGYLSHYPEKPYDMPDELYKIGSMGASSSNLAAGFPDFWCALVDAWMNDGDPGNIDRIGHRRWVLNPPMKKVGFGIVRNLESRYRSYSAMYVFDNWYEETDYRKVLWPARNMPIEFFDSSHPWSISVGERVDGSNVKINVKDIQTKQEWNLYEGCEDGYFKVDNGGYGQTGCIIFRPQEIICSEGKQFEVTVSGLEESFSYTVDFFAVEDYYEGNINSELISFDLKQNENGAYYLNGQIVVVEWVNGISTVPKDVPTMIFKSTDGTEEIEVFVTPTGTNTYYFDRFIEGLSPDKEYVFEISSGTKKNVSLNRSMNVLLSTSPQIVSVKNLGKIGEQKISYYQAHNGELRLYRRNSTYVGNINSELIKTELVKGPNGNYVSGQIVVVEWENGVSTVPFETPVMYFKSTDGTESLPVFVTPTGTNTYYFDRSLGDMDTSKEYIFSIASGDHLNVSPYRSMVVTTAAMQNKSGTLWESETQYVRYRTDVNTAELRIYAVDK